MPRCKPVARNWHAGVRELAASGHRGHDVPDYVVRHGAAALAAAGDSQALLRLADPQWMRLSAARTGHLQRSPATCCSPRRPPVPRPRLTGCGTAATLAMVTSADIAAGVPPAALGVLAMAGQAKRAMDLAAMVEPVVRSDGYYRIAIALLGAAMPKPRIPPRSRPSPPPRRMRASPASATCCRRLTRSLHQTGGRRGQLRALPPCRLRPPPTGIDGYLAVGILADAATLTVRGR